MMEDYVIMFKTNGKSQSYTNSPIFAVQSFCEANEKLGVNWKKIRRLLGKKQRSKKTRPYTREEIKRMIHSTKSIRNKAIILFLSASGVRRGALSPLRMRDLKEMPHGCMQITVYAEDNEEYITFINKEASDALNLFIKKRKSQGEIITEKSFVFTTIYKLQRSSDLPIDESNISSMIQRVKINAGVDLGGDDNLLCHAFRRRFNTILKLTPNSNATIIERLMGHDMKLDNSYFQPTIEQLFEEYQKGMLELTIDDEDRLKVERENLKEELTKLEEEKAHSKELESRMAKYEENQDEMLRVMDMIRSGKATLVKSEPNEIHVKLNQ